MTLVPVCGRLGDDYTIDRRFGVASELTKSPASSAKPDWYQSSRK